MRHRLPLLAVVLVAGCTSMQEQYSVRRSNISCEEANRYALQSLRTLGYEVKEFRLAAIGREGFLKATRSAESDTASSGTVTIRCEPNEVVLKAADEQFLKQDLTFTRGFYISFTNLADHGEESAAYQKKLEGGTTSGGAKFKIQPQIGLETKLDFGEDLASAGVVAVKVTVENGSGRTYKLDPSSIELRTAAGGEKVLQMPPAAVTAALVKTAAAEAGEGVPQPDPQRVEALLHERALTARTLGPGDHAEGFVYFPTGQYSRARATLVDTETEEDEGFLVEF